MPIFVLKRGDLCDRMSSRENEARFLQQNEVKFALQRNEMAANLDLFRMHLHRMLNTNTKLYLWSPIVDHENLSKNPASHSLFKQYWRNVELVNEILITEPNLSTDLEK